MSRSACRFARIICDVSVVSASSRGSSDTARSPANSTLARCGVVGLVMMTSGGCGCGGDRDGGGVGDDDDGDGGGVGDDGDGDGDDDDDGDGGGANVIRTRKVRD